MATFCFCIDLSTKRKHFSHPGLELLNVNVGGYLMPNLQSPRSLERAYFGEIFVRVDWARTLGGLFKLRGCQ